MIQASNRNKIFRVNLKTELPYNLIIFSSIFIVGLLTGKISFTTWPLIVVFLLVLVGFSLLLYRVVSIEVDAEKGIVAVIKANLIGSKKQTEHPLSALQFTYKVTKTGFRSPLRNVCTLYVENKKVAKVIPDYDGWTGAAVHDLAKGLLTIGVPKKFTGYSFKDAPINGL